MAKDKSLCKSCSNRVVIKFHGKHIRSGISEGECFYNFIVLTSNNKYKKWQSGATESETHVAHIIVDECSFYNKSVMRVSKRKKQEDNNDSNETTKNNDKRSGVTFTNIPGALLP